MIGWTMIKTLDPDQVHFGLMFLARKLAIQYGDGQAITGFWKDSLHWTHRLQKVKGCI
jgi:hypothetical protein